MSVRRTLAALGTLLLLAGCGGDPKPKVDPSPSSPTTSATQSQTAKPESAEDLIRAYVKLSLDAQNSGDTSKFTQAFPKCRQCLQQAKLIEGAYSKGGYIDSGEWTITSIKLAGHVGARYEYNLNATADPGRSLAKKGAKVKHYPGGETELRLVLYKRPTGWLLTDIQAM